VVVAVPPVGMMQVALHEIIHMIAVRDTLMTTVWTVNVICLMCTAAMFRSALVLICGIDWQLVFIDVALVDMVQVSIVEIVSMAVVFDGGVAAIRAVDV
jgi:hypothetical protein